MEAGQAGGKRRRRKMRGGTSKGMYGRLEGTPLDAALTH
jgi:2-methylaconitate cis-trans-isomerase PrpF